jgi:hypothetical protein
MAMEPIFPFMTLKFQDHNRELSKQSTRKSQNNPFHETKNITNEVRLVIVMYLKLEL